MSLDNLSTTAYDHGNRDEAQVDQRSVVVLIFGCISHPSPESLHRAVEAGPESIGWFSSLTREMCAARTIARGQNNR